MVLVLRIFIGILLFTSVTAKAQNMDLFYTDKYDVNYFSKSNIQNTELYFGSDLFHFITKNNQKQLTAFIDSFFVTENISIVNQYEILEQNKLKYEIQNADAAYCNEISNMWTQTYVVNFKKLLFKQINEIDLDSTLWTAENLIFRKLITDEISRFYNPGNSVNNISLAFVIPKQMAQNDFINVGIDYNTKRKSERESELNATEWINQDHLSQNEMLYFYPSLNKQTFMRNCLSLSIFEIVYKDLYSFQNKYYINQVVSSFKTKIEADTIKDFKIKLEKLELSDARLKQLVDQAVSKIIAISKENLFYYSFYDINKLKRIVAEYTAADFQREIDLLNERNKFVIAINDETLLKYQNNTLLAFSLLDLEKEIPFKKNSLKFENASDSIYIIKLIQFLKANEDYGVAIFSGSKKEELFPLDKKERKQFVAKFETQGFSMSRKKDLALYRSMKVLNDLVAAGISYRRIETAGMMNEKPYLKLNLSVKNKFKKISE